MRADIAAQTVANENWELRQKHASFFQTQLGSTQQAAIASQTTAALLLTLAFAASKFSGLSVGDDKVVALVGVLGWLLLGWIFVRQFSRSACRIRDVYLEEQAALFPGTTPYRLESFLLDFADNGPARRKRPAKQVAIAAESAVKPEALAQVV